MPKASSQKFIARSRAPRVQIEYDVEVYGAQKKIELPFVVGVMADLSGKPADPLRHRHTEDLVLLGPIAKPHSKQEPAARNDIQKGAALRKLDRVVQGKQGQVGADP